VPTKGLIVGSKDLRLALAILALTWNQKGNQALCLWTDCIFKHLEYSFVERCRRNEVLVSLFEVGAEGCAEFVFVRLGRAVAQIVSHTLENVKANDAQHGRLIMYI
jgi:hypothetical protein